MPKAKRRLRYKESRYAAAGLPFYGETGDYWCLPATGGGTVGRNVGKVMATAYLKHMSEVAETDTTPLMHYIALSMREHMLAAVKAEDKAAQQSIHGQSLGFFEGVCNFIRQAMVEAPKLAEAYRSLNRRTIEKEADRAARL